MLELERDPFVNQSIEKLRHLGIDTVLFDLDDSLIYTGEIFREQKAVYVEKVHPLIGMDPEVLSTRIQELNDEEFFRSGVSPKRWITVLDRLSQELNDHPAIKENLSIFMEIYTRTPRIRPGARAVLDELKKSHFKIGLITHAGIDWTLMKLEKTGLIDYFDAIEVADEFKHKSAQHWQNCIDMLGVKNNQCLAFGDNLKGDIIPTVSLGTKAIWMPSPWSVYREGVVPEGVVQINELTEFWDGVQKLT